MAKRRLKWHIDDARAAARDWLRQLVAPTVRRAQLIDASALESRVLLSASPLAGAIAEDFDTGEDANVADWVTDAAVAESTLSDASHSDDTPNETEQLFAPLDAPQLENATIELVFVDVGTDGYQQLVDDLLANSDPNRELLVHLLDASRDGVAQISEVLKSHTNVDAMHFVSHGSEGEIKLGSTWLTIRNLPGYAADIADWNVALRDGADLLIYGCDVAATEDGRLLTEALGTLCNCDVAASTDDTGDSALGGDWDLEYAVRPIETSIVFSANVQENWGHVLATPGYGSLLFSTISNVGSSGISELPSWNDDEILQVGNPSLSYGTSTDGTFSTIMNLADYAGGNADVDSLHVVRNTHTINGVTLNPGDLLLSTNQDVWLDGVFYTQNDLIVFHPTAAGVYNFSSGGTFEMVVDNLTTASNDLRDVALVEENMTVGGWNLVKSEILFSRSSANDDDILHYDPLTDTISSTPFIDGSDIGIGGNWIRGIELVESTVTIGGETVNSGRILATISNFSDTVGNSGPTLGIGIHDIFELEVLNAGSSTIAAASMFFDGGDVSLNSTEENIYPIALFLTQTPNTLVVDTTDDYSTADARYGNTTSISALLADKGTDNLITLREAIEAANNTSNGATPDEIHFDIQDSDSRHFYYRDDGTPNDLSLVATTTLDDASITDFDVDHPYAAHSWFSIEVDTALPQLEITDAVIIDGYTQSGATTNTLAVGDDAAIRIELTSDGTNGRRGLTIEDGGDGSTIRGLAINNFSNAGIMMEPGADGVTIQGNFLGTDITGSIDVGNGDGGVHVRSSSNQIGGPNAADRNLISGNDSRGVITFTFGPIESANVVENNYIGVDSTGLTEIQNNAAGIQVWNQDGMVIRDNVISGNDGEAIWLRSGSTKDNTIIQGNLIGVGADGVTHVANNGNGILIHGNATNTIIGGTLPGEGNIIAGNSGHGVHSLGDTVDGTIIQANSIGVDGVGASLGNNDGIRIEDDSDNNLIGGTAAGAGNIIANNLGDGVLIKDAASTGNSILGNSIFSNNNLGIDLDDDNETDNDDGDLDSGSNNRQNFPVLTRVITNGGDVTISGWFNSIPSTLYRLEFFASSTPDPGGNGEGETYIDFLSIATDANGFAAFSQTFTHSVSVGEVVSATATSASGDTSEFSLAVTAETDQVTVDGLWLSTQGNVSSPSGSPGLDSWTDGEAISFGGPGLDLEPTSTVGSFASALNLNLLGDGNVDIDGIHYVTQSVTIGGSLLLDPGDILISTVQDESFFGGTFSVQDEDVFLLRPVAPGEYSVGTMKLVLDLSDPDLTDPDLNVDNIMGISLVEQNTMLGGHSLNAGELLFTRNGGAEQQDIYVFDITGVGEDSTAGTAERIIEGTTLGFSEGITGLELIESGVSIGGVNLASGDLLLTLDNGTTILDLDANPSNDLAISEHDVFVLNVTQTELNGGTLAPSAALLFEGVEVGLVTGNENLDALSVPATSAANSPPAITSSLTPSIVENQTTVQTLTAFDPDADSVTFTITGGIDSGHFNINGSNELEFIGAPDFEAPTDFDIDNVYEVEVTADDGNGNQDVELIQVTVIDSTVLDQFSTVSYSNNDGPNNWTGDWQELGETTNPSAGRVRIVGSDRVRIGGNDVDINGRGLYREVDFSGATTATLSFNYERRLLDDTGGSITVSMSDDGGTSWTDIKTYFLTGTDSAPIHEEFDVSAFVSANMQVRILGSGSDVESRFFIDDIEIRDEPITNNPPIITSDGGGALATTNVPENTTTVTTVTATDVDLETPSFSIVGGTDSAHFTISPTTGLLSFIAAPDFEAPTDDDLDNVYEVEVQADDGVGGIDTQVIEVTVDPVNEEESLTTNLGLTLPQSATSTITTSLLETTDDDNSPAQLTYTINTATGNGTLRLGATALGVSDTFTQDDVDSNLITYQHNGTPTISDNFSFDVDDGLGTFSSGTFNITITGVNTEEVLGPMTPLAVTEGSTGTNITTTELQTTDAEQAPAQLVYTVTARTSNGTLRLSGTALGDNDTFTQADIDGNLVTYDHDGSETTSDSFDFDVDDGLGTVSSGTFNINVTLVNDSPVVATNTGSTVNEGSTSNLITTAMLNEGDPDDAGTGLTYSVTTAPSNGTLRLSGLALAASDTFTQDDIDNNRITYDHDGTPTPSDFFDFSLADGGEDGAVPASGRFNISVSAVNDPPAIATNTGTTVGEGSTGNVIATTMLNEGDPDDAGTGLTYTVTGIPTEGTLRLSGIVLSINDTFTQADIDSSRITYDHSGNEASTDSFDFILADGGEDGATPIAGTFSIAINGVNDSPLLNVPGPQTANEDLPRIINGISVADADAGSFNIQLTLTVSNGTLSINTAIASGLMPTDVLGNNTNSIVVTATLAEINTTLTSPTGLAYQSNLNYFGPDTLSVFVQDLGNFGSGPVGTDLAFVDINVQPINDAPVGIDESFSVLNDSILSVPANGVLANDFDVESDPLSVLLVVAPTDGTLVFNADGSFTYTPDAEFVGSDRFYYVVNDGLTNSAPVHVTIIVNSAVIPPIVTPVPVDMPSAPEPPDNPESPPADPPAAVPSNDAPKRLESQPTRRTSLPAVPAFVPIAPQTFVRIEPPEEELLVSFSTVKNRTVERREKYQESRETDFSFRSDVGSYWDYLDHARDEMEASAFAPNLSIGSAAGFTSVLSAGYVVWLIRGGHILAGLMAQLPAWRMIDPLPILAQLQGGDEEDDEDDSLASLVDTDRRRLDQSQNSSGRDSLAKTLNQK